MKATQANKTRRVGSKMEFDMEYSIANGKLIGQGSFGSVYKLQSSDDNQYWAVKVIEVPNRQSEKEGAEHEMDIFLAMDSHPNIISIKQVYTWENDLTHKFATVIVQELADQGLYEQFIDRKNKSINYSDQEILDYLTQSVDALNFLMKKNGIYHRDIKTENLLLKSNKIKITDFGMSKRLEEERVFSMRANTITGTPLFLSPKLWDAYIKRGESSVFHDLEKSDIFSLGLIFLQLSLLLTNSELSGLNQDGGEKKLLTFLNRLKSNKLRTIFAAMLSYEEPKRATYQVIQQFLNMQEFEFTSSSVLPYLQYQQPPQPVQYIPSSPKYNIPPSSPLGFDLKSDRPICYKHNKSIDFFCEECYENLCADCQASHPPHNQNKIIPYKQAVSKYIDQNQLNLEYTNLQQSLQRDIKAKSQNYQDKLKIESMRMAQEFKQKMMVVFDQSLNNFTSKIQGQLQSSVRDCEQIQNTILNDERSLKDSQYKFKMGASNSIFLQIIAKAQQTNLNNISQQQEKLNKITSDINNFASIDQMYIYFLTQFFSFEKNLQNSIEQFLNSMISTGNKPMNKCQSQNNIVTPQINPYSPSNSSDSAGQQPIILTPPIPYNSGARSKSPNNLFGNAIPNTAAPLFKNNSANYEKGSPKDPNSVAEFQAFNSNPPPPTFKNISKSPFRTNQALQVKNNAPIETSSGKSTGSSTSGEGSFGKTKTGLSINDIQLIPSREFILNDGMEELMYIERSKCKLLIGAESNGKVVKINLDNNEKSEVEIPSLKIKSFIYNQSSKRLICGTQEGRIVLFDPLTMKTIEVFQESQNSSICCIAQIEKKPIHFLCGGSNGSVGLWNIEKKQLERVYSKVHDGEVKQIYLISNETQFITIGSDSQIIITELNSNKTLLSKNNCHKGNTTYLKKVGESQFFTAGSDGRVKLWKLEHNGMSESWDKEIHKSEITYLDFLEEYSVLITSGNDGSIILSDPPNNISFANNSSKPLKGKVNRVRWVKPLLFSCDQNGVQINNNPQLAQSMMVFKKKKEENTKQQCKIF